MNEGLSRVAWEMRGGGTNGIATLPAAPDSQLTREFDLSSLKLGDAVVRHLI